MSGVEALASNLPCEIIRLILLKLPSKSLLRFKCVSKSWHSLISDPHFILSHHNLSRTKPIIFYPNSNNSFSTVYADREIRVENLHFPDHYKARILCSLEGLVLLEDKTTTGDCATYYLLNPSVRKYTKFFYPCWYFPEDSVLSYGLYFDSVACDYNVIVVLEDHYLIYSVGRDTWGDRKAYPYPGTLLRSCVFVDGALYWEADPSAGSVPGEIYVMCFDPMEESFSMFARPEVEYVVDVPQFLFRLIAFQGCLGFLSRTDVPGQVKIWLRNRNDCSDLSCWETLMIISDIPCPSDGGGYVRPLCCYVRPLCYVRGDEILLYIEGGKLVLYDVKEKKFVKVDVPSIARYSCPFTYVDSLLLPGVGDNPKRKWLKTETSECKSTGSMMNWRRMLFRWMQDLLDKKVLGSQLHTVARLCDQN